jgi:hypothetical protein
MAVKRGGEERERERERRKDGGTKEAATIKNVNSCQTMLQNRCKLKDIIQECN